jgi:hypothetical protein
MVDVACEARLPPPDHREFFLLGSTLLILVGYHIWFMVHTRRSAGNTVFGFARTTREIWVKRMFSSDSLVLPAVQSMRNEMFVGIFLGDASFTAVTVIVSAVSAIDLTCTLRSLSRSDPLMGPYEETTSPIVKALPYPMLLRARG